MTGLSYLQLNVHRTPTGHMLVALVKQPGGKFPKRLWCVHEVPLGIPSDASPMEIAETIRVFLERAVGEAEPGSP